MRPRHKPKSPARCDRAATPFSLLCNVPDIKADQVSLVYDGVEAVAGLSRCP